MTVKIKHLWIMATLAAAIDFLSVVMAWTSYPRERLGGAVSVLLFVALVHFVTWLFWEDRA